MHPAAGISPATSAFTPFGGLAYGHDAISVQHHPEFAPDYAAALIEGRRGDRIDVAVADAAIDSLNGPDDRAVMGEWIRRFLAD